MDPAALMAQLNEDIDGVASMYSGDDNSEASFSFECRQLLEQENEHLEDFSSREVVSEIVPIFS